MKIYFTGAVKSKFNKDEITIRTVIMNWLKQAKTHKTQRQAQAQKKGFGPTKVTSLQIVLHEINYYYYFQTKSSTRASSK